MSRLPWYELAACIGHAPLFDAAPDVQVQGRTRREEREADTARHSAAAAICKRCPVTRQCLADAVIGRDEGVRAGRLLPSLDEVRKERWAS